MTSEAAPNPQKSAFEQEIIETVDSGYVGPVKKQLGEEKVTLSEIAKRLGDKAPSAKIIEEMGLLDKPATELGVFGHNHGITSKLENQTIFLGTKFTTRDGRVYFKTFSPAEDLGHKSFYTYTSGDSESKYYGVALPVETNEQSDYQI